MTCLCVLLILLFVLSYNNIVNGGGTKVASLLEDVKGCQKTFT